MTTELDQDNLVSAIKGEPLIRSCVTCKYYRSYWLSEPDCVVNLELKYHPITGKKAWMGTTYNCENMRCIDDYSRPPEPCGPDGKHWEEKEAGGRLFNLFNKEKA